jgi:sirohydrochlorin ferrochelatase
MVRYSFLDLASPRTGPVLARLAAAGHRQVVVVPLLLTAAYHSRVDVPAVLAAAAPPGLVVRRTGVLGPDPRLVEGLMRRLGPGADFDAVVLAAAGCSDPDALRAVRATAAALGERYGLPCQAGYASAEPDVATVMRRLRRSGAERVAVASYFLAPGLLYDRVTDAARRAGAAAVAEPLVAVPELVRVVSDRFAGAWQGYQVPV